MKHKTFNITGGIMLVSGLLALIFFLPNGIIKDIIGAFNIHGDYWLGGYILIPLVFIFFGAKDLWIGIHKEKLNNWFMGSLVFQCISLIVALFGIALTLNCNLRVREFCNLILLLAGIPVSILTLIALILLIIGWIVFRIRR
jgi:hypothetical protein